MGKDLEARKLRTEARNEKIKERFSDLYNGKARRRYDDVIQLLADEYFMTPSWIERIVRYSGDRS